VAGLQEVDPENGDGGQRVAEAGVDGGDVVRYFANSLADFGGFNTINAKA
jgi:hypothetical protein